MEPSQKPFIMQNYISQRPKTAIRPQMYPFFHLAKPPPDHIQHAKVGEIKFLGGGRGEGSSERELRRSKACLGVSVHMRVGVIACAWTLAPVYGRRRWGAKSERSPHLAVYPHF